MMKSLVQSSIPLNACVSQASGPVSADLSGEIAILDPASGLYFGLNEVGAFIWKLLGEGSSVGRIISTVLETYQVAREDCEADVLQLLSDLHAAGLIKIDATDY